MCLAWQHLGAASTRTLPNWRFAIRKSVLHERCRISSETYKSHWRCSFFFSVRLLVCDEPGTAKAKQRQKIIPKRACCTVDADCRAQCDAQKWPERRQCYYRWALIIFTFYIRRIFIPNIVTVTHYNGLRWQMPMSKKKSNRNFLNRINDDVSITFE